MLFLIGCGNLRRNTGGLRRGDGIGDWRVRLAALSMRWQRFGRSAGNGRSLESSRRGKKRSRFVRIKFLPPFFPEGPRWLRLFWASLRIRVLEDAGRAFYVLGFLGVVKREYPGDQKSHAPIPDQGFFQATLRVENSIRCEGVFCFDMPPGGREIVSRKRKIAEKRS